MALTKIVTLIWAFAALGLIVFILLHSPKGDGLGGIGGQAQLFTSTKSAEKTLNRMTWTFAVIFLGLTVILSLPRLPAAPTGQVQIPGMQAESQPQLDTASQRQENEAAIAIPNELTSSGGSN
jgi:preprotein translocase subunit SecG